MPVRGCSSRGSSTRGDPLPETRNRPIVGGSSSCPLLPQKNSSLATQARISLQFLPIKGSIQTSRGWISILAPLGPGTMLTLNPGTFGTVTGVSQTHQRNHQAKRLHFGRTILVGTGTMFIVDVVPGVIAGPKDGQRVLPDSGITLSLMSRPLSSLRVSLLFLC